MSKEQLQDKIAILKARTGDKSAFVDVYNRYITKIYRFVYFKTNNKEIAEDITSHTFLKIWEKILSGGEIKSLQALLYQAARNLVIDYYRSASKNKELPLEFETHDQADNYDEKIHARIDKDLLIKALNDINNEDYKEILVLRYVEGFSVGEIAKILDISKNNVTTISHRAIAQLRKSLEDYNG